MKHIILAIAIVLTGLTFAQDVARLESMAEPETKAFATQINNTIRTPWKFFKLENKSDFLRYYFVPPNTSAKKIAEIKAKGIEISGVDYYVIQFASFMEGEDKELEIKGVKKYYFYQVILPLLDAIKVWETLFFNGATIEEVRNYKNNEIKIEETGTRIKFRPNVSPKWIIALRK